MLHVGLTGGLASGKSTVARIVAELGASIIDADAIARDVVEPGAPGLDAVVAAFGRGVLHPDGSLDRAALAAEVFDDDAALRTLNGIVHPLVRSETEARVARLAELDPGTIVVHDVPLIVENGMSDQYHLVLVVGASITTRTQRAVARGMTQESAIARIDHQADDAARRRAADVWIDNEGDSENLREVVELLWRARVQPFAENLQAGRCAEPGEPETAPDPERRQQQVDRLLARLDRAAAGQLTGLRSIQTTGEAALDLIRLEAVTTGGTLDPDALRGAGFVAAGEAVFGNADPGRPAVLTVTG